MLNLSSLSGTKLPSILPGIEFKLTFLSLIRRQTPFQFLVLGTANNMPNTIIILFLD